MDIKNFIFKHIEKFILIISISYFVYTTIHTFIIRNSETRGINTKLLSLSATIDRKLKTSKPPDIRTELNNAAQLELRFTTPPPPNALQRPYIFSKFTNGDGTSDITTRDLLNKTDLQSHPGPEVDTPGDIEFIFKGGTADLALIHIRKLYKDKWWAESFTIGKGERIGGEKTLGGEAIDFNTHCKLVSIVLAAQKPFIVKKTLTLRNEKGEFIGTSLTEETHLISTSKITFEDKKSGSYNLWIGELANLGTETVTIHSANTSSAN